MTSMTSCIVEWKIRAMGPGPLELFPFVVLAILLAMAGVLLSICSLHGLVKICCFYTSKIHLASIIKFQDSII